MNEREALLRKISAAQFASWELHIYLDTHPDDAQAKQSFEKYKERSTRLIAEFNEKFGPLTVGQIPGNSSWSWIKDPWPWEEQEEE